MSPSQLATTQTELWTPSDPATGRLLGAGGAVVPVLGAGMSAPAGLSGVAQLAEALRDHPLAAGLSFSDPDNAQAVADTIIGANPPGTEDKVRRFVADHFRAQQVGKDLGQTLRNLVNCPSRIILTFNYDQLVEKAAEQQKVPCSAHTWKNLPPPYWMSEGADPGLHVIHLHGCVDDPDSIVLDSGGYERVKHDRSVLNWLENLFSQMTTLFMGTSLSEPYILRVIEGVPVEVPRHVFLNDEASSTQARRGHLAVAAQHEVLIEPFGPGRFGALEQVALDLSNARRERKQALPPAPRQPYTPLQIVPYKEGESDGVASIRAMSGFADPVDEEDLLTANRAVIRGAPGSGKSDLLKRVAQLSAGFRHRDPRVIRLAEATRPLGSPESVLSTWAGLEGPEALESRQLLFLLDGLDEVAESERERFVETIVKAAAALPQHRFILTSREIPELSLLPAPWRSLQIAPSSDWRADFLDQFQTRAQTGDRLSWSVLLEEVPELAAIEPLFRLPFFIRALVDLYLDDKLPKTGDLLALLDALIEGALDAPELRPIAKETRHWLTKTALALQLNGRVELSRDVMNSIGAETEIGDPDEVIERLINRSLLRDGGDASHAFLHRILADALVALWLDEVGPEHAGLLASIAPQAGSVRGVRRDWQIPVILVGGRSKEWRASVREVDPLAAARCVPPSADLAERRGAAETLWRTYLETRVWMHDRDQWMLLDDEEHLPRLLDVIDMPELIEEITEGFSSPSPMVRVNAIQVLSRVAGADIEEALSDALGAEEETVRRAAAMAAQRLGLTSLYPQIRALAVQAREVEAQEIGPAALRLAPQAELLALATDLTAKGEVPDYYVEREVERRLGPAGRLRLLRVQARVGNRYSLNERHGLTKLLPDLDHDDPEVLRDIGYIAVAWDTQDEEIKSFIGEHPEECLRGMLDAVEDGSAPAYHLLRFLDRLPEEAIAAAEFPDELSRQEPNLGTELLERRRQLVTPRPSPTPVTEEPRPANGGSRSSPPEPSETPTLPELLDAGDERPLLTQARELVGQVEELEAAHRERLRELVDQWWPSNLGSTITRHDEHRSTIQWGTLACLTYGPALMRPLTPAEWVDVAVAGEHWQDDREWLRTSYSSQADPLLAVAMRGESSPAAWADALESMPRFPGPALRNVLWQSIELDQSPDGVAHLAAVLARQGHKIGLRELLKLGDHAEVPARSHLAALGDVPSQRWMLGRLRGQFGQKVEITAADLHWMNKIEDGSLLPLVFDCLVPAWSHPNPSGFSDAMAPIRAAIRRIDGQDSLDLLDELVAQDPEPYQGAHFEVLLRQEIADDMLRRAGQSADQQLLQVHGLPVLG